MAITAKYLSSINDIDAESWNSITGCDYPFTRHEFLSALENSGAVCLHTGWQAQHLTLYEDNCLRAVVPLYLKHHSYGEYVFDWAWADAFHRHGVNYYPKLLAAIPFTPATGPRLCIDPAINDTQHYRDIIQQQLIVHAQAHALSSLHILFPQQSELYHSPAPLMTRQAVQFHWFNQDYQNFDDFLQCFSSRKRKNLNKERRQVIEQGIQLQRLKGSEVSPEQWQQFHHFYQLTYAKRSGHGGYLNAEFFQAVAASMPENILLVVAEKANRMVAAALYFYDSQTLYGRYWGCVEEYAMLHFEACYYQGIEYCIENQLQRFDPGAQGEHKIARGFTPIFTYSQHWINHPAFADAIADFLQREKPEIETYQQYCAELLPFKHTP